MTASFVNIHTRKGEIYFVISNNYYLLRKNRKYEIIIKVD